MADPATAAVPRAFSVAVGEYLVRCVVGAAPGDFDRDTEHATLVDRLGASDGEQCCTLVSRVGDRWPFLVITQDVDSYASPFGPGLLLAPDVGRLFIGAGARIAAYDLTVPRRLWARGTPLGMWSWARHGDVVLMLAELELTGWTVTGEPLWTAFVEPPWEYTVEDGVVVLDVMGIKERFPLDRGP